ncbi:MAG: type II secretion system F family protein [Candidatus Woesearchaeota archaeon]
MAFDFLGDFGKAFVPKSVQPHLRVYLEKAGVYRAPYKFFGVLFYLTLIATLFIFLRFLWPYLREKNPIVLFMGAALGWAGVQLGLVALVIVFIYVYLDIRIFKRVQDMETHLPDYLALVSSHLKGGMGMDAALFSAIKPRFGALSVEMTLISKKVVTGYDLKDALEEFGKKYNSPMIRRGFNLIAGELETGGRIAHIIDQVVLNLKRNHKLKMEMSASVVTYMIFIGAIVIVIAPALFALSFHLLSFISEFATKIAAQGAVSTVLPIKIPEEGIDTSLFRNFSMAAIGLVALFSSLIVSIIERGTIRAGLKYIPIFFVGSLVVYFVFSAILGVLFSGIQF